SRRAKSLLNRSRQKRNNRRSSSIHFGSVPRAVASESPGARNLEKLRSLPLAVLTRSASDPIQSRRRRGHKYALHNVNFRLCLHWYGIRLASTTRRRCPGNARASHTATSARRHLG